MMRGVTGRLLAAAWLVPLAGAAPPPDFIRDVQPVLESRCWGCHGGKLQMHGLRLDRRADALKGGGSGVPAIVPGASSQSLLIKYVAGPHPGGNIPPSGGPPPPAPNAVLSARGRSGRPGA